MRTAETGRSRRRLVEEAGWSTTSFISVLAGTLVAFGALALLAAAAGAAGSGLGFDTDGMSTDEWRQAGVVGAAIAAVVVFASFWFGGYTAGRMGRRAGALHGVLVVVCSVLLLAAIGLVGWAVADGRIDVESEMTEQGVPTDGGTWSGVGLGAGIAGGLAMIAGSILGGIRGDRWHGRLATAVVDRREQLANDEAELTRQQHAMSDERPEDHTAAIDLRETDEDRTSARSVEEERERAHVDHAI